MRAEMSLLFGNCEEYGKNEFYVLNFTLVFVYYMEGAIGSVLLLHQLEF